MAKVSTNITIDSETKVKAQALLADLGMDLSTAVNIFLRQMLRENAFPFLIQGEASAVGKDCGSGRENEGYEG